MDTQSKIYKISSKYIFNKIFEFIKDQHFRLKLFIYSKSLQKKLEINFYDYQLISLNNFNLDISRLLYSYSNTQSSDYSKNYYKKERDKIFKDYNIDKKIYEPILANFIELYLQKKKEKYDNNIKDFLILNEPFPFEEKFDIHSEFFNELIKKIILNIYPL